MGCEQRFRVTCGDYCSCASEPRPLDEVKDCRPPDDKHIMKPTENHAHQQHTYSYRSTADTIFQAVVPALRPECRCLEPTSALDGINERSSVLSASEISHRMIWILNRLFVCGNSRGQRHTHLKYVFFRRDNGRFQSIKSSHRRYFSEELVTTLLQMSKIDTPYS